MAVAAPSCFGQHPIPESERWATITHAGNEPYIFDPPGNEPPRPIGGVDYEYQISRTEVTGAEWLEFVNAYAPYVDANQVDNSLFTSFYIRRVGPREYAISPGAVNKPVEIGWRFAARYVNWLHNDKGTDQASFEDGAYDTSTFGDLPNGTITDQASRHPDARYWIPTQDEIVKASHFDPNRYGEGKPGYWYYSNTSDTAPLPGHPTQGGETSTGRWQAFPLPDVASYIDVRSPWGLWDTSGGAAEWTESADISDISPSYSIRYIEGSAWSGWSANIEFDQVDYFTGLGPSHRFGFRVARMVPGVSSVSVFSCALLFLRFRKRRCFHENRSPDRARERPAGLAAGLG
jgi:formylglycine-generating enzyme required for sulfatase activity